jgi:hypothetical protein
VNAFESDAIIRLALLLPQVSRGIWGGRGNGQEGSFAALIGFMAFGKLRGNIEFANSVRDDGEGGEHALSDRNVEAIFTTFDLSSPIIRSVSNHQNASR